MHGALARQMHARVQRRNHMGVPLLVEHDGGRATRLPVHGNAHLLALATIGNRAVDVEHRHEHERRFMLSHLARPLAHAVLAEAERAFGIVARD